MREVRVVSGVVAEGFNVPNERVSSLERLRRENEALRRENQRLRAVLELVRPVLVTRKHRRVLDRALARSSTSALATKPRSTSPLA